MNDETDVPMEVVKEDSYNSEDDYQSQPSDPTAAERRGIAEPRARASASPVECWDATGEHYYCTFPSAKTAMAQLKISALSSDSKPLDSKYRFVVDCIIGYRARAFGYCWKPESIGERQQTPIEDMIAARTPEEDANEVPTDAAKYRIECCNLDGSERMKFPNIGDAARFFKVPRGDILDCCYGERKTLKKRRWEFLSEGSERGDSLQTISPTEYYESKCALPVDCWSYDSKRLLRRFADSNEAARVLEIPSPNAVVDCCLGKKWLLVGFKFKFRSGGSAEAPVPMDEDCADEDLLALRKPQLRPSSAAEVSCSKPPETEQVSSSEKQVPVEPSEEPSPRPPKGIKAAVAIDCWSGDGSKMLYRFNSLSDIRKYMHIHKPEEVVECCSGARELSFGLRWKFSDKTIPSDAQLDLLTLPEVLSMRVPPYRAQLSSAVDCWTHDNSVFLRRFSSRAEVIRELRIKDLSTLVDCMSGATPSLVGFVFRVADKDRSEADCENVTFDQLRSMRIPLIKKAGAKSKVIDKAESISVVEDVEETGPIDSASHTPIVSTVTEIEHEPVVPSPTVPSPVVPSPVSNLSASSNQEQTVGEATSNMDQISPAVGRDSGQVLAIDCLSAEDRTLLRRFPSVKAAKKALYITEAQVRLIRKSCEGTRTFPVIGFHWKFSDESIEPASELSVEDLILLRKPPLTTLSEFRQNPGNISELEATKAVESSNLDGSEVIKYKNISQAARNSKVSKKDILDCIYGARSCVQRRRYRFVSDEQSESPVAEGGAAEAGNAWDDEELDGAVKDMLALSQSMTLVSEINEVVMEEEESQAVSNAPPPSPVQADISSLLKNNRNNAISVDCWSSEETPRFLARFFSISEAVKVLRLHRRCASEIRECLASAQGTSFGFQWRLADANIADPEEVSEVELLRLRNPPLEIEVEEVELPPAVEPKEIEDAGRILESRGNRTPIPVVCYSVSDPTKVLKRFGTIGDALLALDLPRKANADVRNCCIGVTESCYGFIWKYTDRSSALDPDDEIPLSALRLLRDPPLDTVIEPEVKVETGTLPLAVDCWALDGSALLRRFSSMSEALRTLRGRSSSSDIKNCCLGRITSAFGFKWTFYDESVVPPSDFLSNQSLLELRDPPLPPVEPKILNEDDSKDKRFANPSRTPIAVDCWSLDGNTFLFHFSNITHAMRALSITKFQDIRECLQGKLESTHGFVWRAASRSKYGPTSDLTLEELQALRDPPLTAEEKETVSIDVRLGGRTAVPVDCWSLDDSKLLRRFASIAEVRDALQIKSTADIREVCTGAKPSAYGFRWKFFDRAMKVSDEDQLSIDELLLLRDPPIYKYARRVIPRDCSLMPIDCYDMDGSLVKQFATVKDAAKGFRLDSSEILDCCFGLVEQYSNKTWRFSESSNYGLGVVSIDCLAYNGELLHRFTNDVEASGLLRIPLADISRCCGDPKESVLGVYFRYSVVKDFQPDLPTSLPRNVSSKVVDLGGVILDSSRQETRQRSPQKSPRKRRVKDDREEMLADGWVFERTENKYIGSQLRRFFAVGGAADGFVEGYLRSDANDGTALWRIRYPSNDCEDAEESELLRYIGYFAADLHELPQQEKQAQLNLVDPAESDMCETTPGFMKQKTVLSSATRPFVGPLHQADVPELADCSVSLLPECTACPSANADSVVVGHDYYREALDNYYREALLLQVVPGNVMRYADISFDDESGKESISPSYVVVLSEPMAASDEHDLKVSAYDGSDTRNMPVSQLKSELSEDELDEILNECDFDFSEALWMVERQFKQRLENQFRERDIELLITCKRLYRDDVRYLYQSLLIQNRIDGLPERAFKEVLDFYHRFISKEANKLSAKLARLFRRADDKLGRRNRSVKSKGGTLEEKQPRKLMRIANPSSPLESAASVPQIASAFEDNFHPIVCTSIADPSLTCYFASPLEASAMLGVAQVALINTIKSKQPHAFGFTWTYSDRVAAEATVDVDSVLLHKQVHLASGQESAVIALECTNSTGEVVGRYESIRDVAAQLQNGAHGIESTELMHGIYRCCNGELNDFIGLQWRYFDSSSMPYLCEEANHETMLSVATF